jgi:hypothetical protein
VGQTRERAKGERDCGIFFIPMLTSYANGFSFINPVKPPQTAVLRLICAIPLSTLLSSTFCCSVWFGDGQSLMKQASSEFDMSMFRSTQLGLDT